MAITATGTPTSDAITGSATLTIANTVAGDADYLVVSAAVFENGAENTTVTWNGTDMGAELAICNPATGWYTYLFGLKAPDTGTHNVVITSQNAGNFLIGCVQGFKGVDQTTPTGTTASDFNAAVTSMSLDVASAVGRLVVNACRIGNTATDIVATGTGTIVVSSHANWYLDLMTVPGAATSTASRSWTTADQWQSCSVNLLPAAEAGVGGLMWL